ncbi:MAG: hypothetical protein H7Z74_09175 [Anaerolineae bacterium]|nr:hypothetical protein [Gemmatimonadaceae bacterium]
MNSDGSGLTQLTPDDAQDADPAWSGDSNKIAFAKAYCNFYCYEYTSDIAIVGVDGTSSNFVTLNGSASNPAWRP